MSHIRFEAAAAQPKEAKKTKSFCHLEHYESFYLPDKLHNPSFLGEGTTEIMFTLQSNDNAEQMNRKEWNDLSQILTSVAQIVPTCMFQVQRWEITGPPLLSEH